MILESYGYKILDIFPTGKANRVYLATYDGDYRVVKQYSGERKFKAKTEFHLYRYLQELGINTPKVYDMFSAEDNSYLALEYIKGESLNDLIENNRLNSYHIKQISKLKKQLSEIILPGSGYIDVVNNSLQGMSTSWEEFLTRATCNDNARALIDNGRVDATLYERCAGFITKYKAEIATDCNVVNHGDLNPGNVIFVGPKAYIIDLELSVLGSPYYDFAWVFNHFTELHRDKKTVQIYNDILTSFNVGGAFRFTPHTLPILQIAISLRSLMYWSTRDRIRFEAIIENVTKILGETND